jgi:hypothetical protein
MLLKLLDGVLKMVLNIGFVLTPGMKDGEKMDISEFLEEKMNVALIAPLILVCQNLTRFKKFK